MIASFQDNKYSRIYLQLIERARSRTLAGYVEKHHVLPVSLGGTDEPQNIVQLTAREHFIAHQLLVKFTSGHERQKMCYALSFFRTANKYHARKLTARQYQVARTAFAEAKQDWQPSAKTRAAVSAAKSGVPLSQEQKDKMSVALARKIPCWYLCGNEYHEHPDFYRFCLDTGIGRANVQAGVTARGFHVLSSGKNKGLVLSFKDLGADKMQELRTAALATSHQARSAAVRSTKRKPAPVQVQDPTPITNFTVPAGASIHLMRDYHERDDNALWFFEDELTQPDIIQSMLNNVAGTAAKIHARRTSVLELDRKVARDFLKQNHLQGAGSGAILYIGLVLEDQLLSVMSFGKARYNPIAKYELLRFASVLNTVVVGGASKLMKYARAELNDGQIVSYADLRYGTGNVYSKLGFTFKGNSKPGYWYVKNGKRWHRSQFQKHKLKAILSDFNPAETEIKNMERHGYDRVFDLGHAIYISP